MRTDLPLAVQLCQAVHAARESGARYPDDKDLIPHVVVCAVDDQESLLLLSKTLASLDVAHTLFYEPDIGNEATALATAPLPQEQRVLFRGLPLWKPQEKETLK